MLDFGPIEKLATAVEKLIKALDINSAGGRMMFGIEVLVGYFLLAILLIVSTENIIAAIYYWFMDMQKQLPEHLETYALLSFGIMAMSLFTVLLREIGDRFF